MTTLNHNRSLLLLVDVQERINGVMSDQEHVPRLEVLLAAAEVLSIPIITTEQYPKGLGSTLVCLKTPSSPPALEKDTFSCARDEQIIAALKGSGRDQIVVTGIESHVCVLQTVLDLRSSGFTVHVPHDAVNSRRTEDKRWALNRMAAAKSTVTSTESVLFEWLERCGTNEFKTISRLLKKIPV